MGGLKSQAETLNLDHVIQKAIASSYELKLANVDIQIGKTDVQAARSDYFPTVRANINTEYLKGLQTGFQPVTAVGNTVIPTGTRYQASASLSFNQTILDFGARKYKVSMAKQSTAAKSATYLQTLRNLKLKLIDLYTEALISYKSIQANEALLELAQQAYQCKKLLYQAGTSSKLEVAEEAIEVAQLRDTVQVYKDQLQQQLQSLSYFTHEPYGLADTELTNIIDEPQAQPLAFSVVKSPEVRIYDALIHQKQNEVKWLKRQALPQVSVYSYYNLYGFNPDRWPKAVTNLSQRTVSLGLSMTLPIFDGFKNHAAIEKAKLEQEKIMLEKSEKLAQLEHQAKLYNSQIEGYEIQLRTKATLLKKAQDKLTLVKRLSDQRIIDQTQAIKEHRERIRKQLEVEKSILQGVSALKKLKVMAEG